MKKRTDLTDRQKKADTDIWILALVTFGAFLIYSAAREPMLSYIKDSASPLPLRLLLNAGVQFALAGLGIVIVCVIRKEAFSSFGLVRKNTLRSVLGAAACFLPYIAYIFISGRFRGYMPFGSILLTQPVLKSAFPMNLFGFALIVLVWGFFEGFNYAVISQKLNDRYPVKNPWLDTGACVCAVVCLLFHPMSFSFWGIIEIISTFAAVYGMLIVKRRTGNAWGCVFVFLFIWNAIQTTV